MKTQSFTIYKLSELADKVAEIMMDNGHCLYIIENVYIKYIAALQEYHVVVVYSTDATFDY